MHSGTNKTYTFDWPWRHDFLASSRLGGGGDCPLALPTWIRPCHRGTILLTPTAVAGVGFSLLFVCLLFFTRYLQKPTQLGSPNLTHRHTSSTMSLRNPLFWGQKVKGQGHESTGMGPCTLVSAGFFYIDYSKWRMARFLRHPVVQFHSEISDVVQDTSKIIVKIQDIILSCIFKIQDTILIKHNILHSTGNFSPLHFLSLPRRVLRLGERRSLKKNSVMLVQRLL